MCTVSSSAMNQKLILFSEVPNVSNITSLMTRFGPQKTVGLTNHSFCAVTVAC